MKDVYLVQGEYSPYLTGDVSPTNRIAHICSTESPREGTPMLCGLKYERANWDGHAWFGLQETMNYRHVTCLNCKKACES